MCLSLINTPLKVCTSSSSQNEDGYCEYVSTEVGGPKTKRLLTPNLQITNVHVNGIKGELVRVVIVSNDAIDLLHPDLIKVQENVRYLAAFLRGAGWAPQIMI